MSFPKSGRTWVRYALAIEGLRPDFTQAGHGARTFELGRGFRGISDQMRQSRIIFLHRNPLDTAVSYFFQLSRKDLRRGSGRWLRRAPVLAALGRMPPSTIDAFVCDDRYGVPLICEFNRCWLNGLETWSKEKLIVSYEDLRADPARGFEPVFGFLGRSDADMQAVAEKSSFDQMRSVERSGTGRDLRLYLSDNDDPESAKVRKGKVKGYWDYLTPATIEASDEIAARYGFQV